MISPKLQSYSANHKVKNYVFKGSWDEMINNLSHNKRHNKVPKKTTTLFKKEKNIQVKANTSLISKHDNKLGICI